MSESVRRWAGLPIRAVLALLFLTVWAGLLAFSPFPAVLWFAGIDDAFDVYGSVWERVRATPKWVWKP